MFSFMDGFSGYNQIKMAPKDVEKTAFRTPMGNFYYTVMPLWLKNAGVTYQRAMTAIFHDMMHQELEDYVDDIVVKSRKGEEHFQVLKRVFERCRAFKLRMNRLKCTFGVSSGKFLGFLVHNRGIDVDPAKVTAIAIFEKETHARPKRHQPVPSQYRTWWGHGPEVRGKGGCDLVVGRGEKIYLRFLPKPLLGGTSCWDDRPLKRGNLRGNRWVHVLRVEREGINIVAGRNATAHRGIKQIHLCLARVDVAQCSRQVHPDQTKAVKGQNSKTLATAGAIKGVLPCPVEGIEKQNIFSE